MSKRWRRRFRRIGKTAVKVGIAVAGVALSGVTGGASVALAGMALAALNKRDQMLAQAAKQRAQAKIAQGQQPAQALLAAIMEVSPPADIAAMIKQDQIAPNYSAAIRAQIGSGPSMQFDSGGAQSPAMTDFPVPKMFATLKGTA